MQKETPPDVQRAVAFFAQAGLSRLLTQLREKYIHVGQVGGQVLLENSTPSERREIASFLGKPPYRDANIKIRLTDFDNALQRSGFACTLPELLSAFFPDSPLVTRPEQRAAHATHQTNFRTALLSIAAELPEGSRGRQWLEQGQHGQEWLFSRYKTPQKKSKSSNFRSYTTLPMFSTSYPAPMSPNAWLSSLGEMWEIGANGRSPREAVCSSRAPPGLLLLKSVNSVRLSGTLDHDDASAGVRARGGPRDVQERRGLDLFDLCRKPRDSPPPVSICLWREAVGIVDQTTRQPRLCGASKRAPIYNMSMEESASEAALSEDGKADSQHSRQIPTLE